MTNLNYLKLTHHLLAELSKAAMQNAWELLEEAAALYENNRFARAYFLAVASIEEIGKSQIAFEGQGRKIADTAIAAKVKKLLEDHSAKITSAFLPWMYEATDMSIEIMKVVGFMVKLKDAREPSMYTDIKIDGSGIHLPSAKVRPIAARDCIRLATRCFESAKRRFDSGVPPKQTTKNQDLLYSMKPKDYDAVMKNQDFWWYVIDLMGKNAYVFEDAVLEYKKSHLDKGIAFAPEKVEINA